MASFNKIIIVGYLGKDPELRYTPQGTPVCNFTIATSEKRKNNYSGETEELTTWFRVTAWQKTAENCAEFLRKGRQAYIEGRLCQEEYTDREGIKRQSLVVNASDVKFLHLNPSDRGEEPSQREETAPEPPKSQSRKGTKKIEDDEIPF